MNADQTEETLPVHDQATEVAHAWDHFYENARFFAGFLAIILLTVLAFNINFGSWNTPVILVLAALRSGLIAYFLASLFKDFSFVFRTLTFTAIFLAAMIFLSLWDSQLRSIGNPIKDKGHPESQNP
jgi:ABC-type polysaccharide/polyol phosphate export permease